MPTHTIAVGCARGAPSEVAMLNLIVVSLNVKCMKVVVGWKFENPRQDKFMRSMVQASVHGA